MPTADQDSIRWRIIKASQIGASHIRDGRPNQDSIDAHIEEDGRFPVILVVSDGHGSEKCFRSEIGSRLAVETCLDVCREFVERMTDETPSTVKRCLELTLSSRIISEWRRRVLSHRVSYPFDESELDREKAFCNASNPQRELEYLPYGATLLGVIITEFYMISFQLGDGDLIAVSHESGEPDQLIPKDELHIANDTNSLCEEKANLYFRCKFQLIQNNHPCLVMISTDGYSNSFSSYDGYLQAGKDIHDMLREEGYDYVNRSIDDWLIEASREGSGDDTTVGIIVREDVLPEYERVAQMEVSLGQDAGPSLELSSHEEFAKKKRSLAVRIRDLIRLTFGGFKIYRS